MSSCYKTTKNAGFIAFEGCLSSNFNCIYLYACVSLCEYVYVHVANIGGQKRVLGPLERGLHMGINPKHHTQVLCKSSTCSELLSCLASPKDRDLFLFV